MIKNPFALKERLLAGEAVFGTFLKSDDPNVAEILGYSGFDFAIIDGEHSAFHFKSIEDVIRGCQVSGLASIVRTNGPDPNYVHHALESGATGVQIPSITCVQDAADCIEEAALFPAGKRSPNPAVRAGHFTLWSEEKPYMQTIKEGTLRVVQVECVEMADKVEELCQIPEIDVLFVGPGDLSLSMGKPGKLTDPEVEAKIADIVKRGLAGGKIMGMLCGSPQAMKKYYDLGVRYLAYSNDRGILAKACKQANEEIFAPLRG